MTQPKQRLWKCPNEEHSGVRAPGRMRADDVRRFCLPCSEATGRLAPRTCPSLDRERSAKKEQASSKRKQKTASKQRTKQRRAAAASDPQRIEVARLKKETFADIDVRAAALAVWALPSAREAVRELDRTPLDLTIRTRRKGSYWTGRAWCSPSRVVLTLPRNITRGGVAVAICHELAHVLADDWVAHGTPWQDLYMTLLRESGWLDTEWPIDAITQRNVSYRAADRIFVQLINGSKDAS